MDQANQKQLEKLKRNLKKLADLHNRLNFYLREICSKTLSDSPYVNVLGEIQRDNRSKPLGTSATIRHISDHPRWPYPSKSRFGAN